MYYSLALVAILVLSAGRHCNIFYSSTTQLLLLLACALLASTLVVLNPG